jgi:general secretion pathway protein G
MLEKVKRLARKIRTNEKGFTLVELMVVVIILGVLAGIAVPQYLNRTKAAKITATATTLKAMQGAINTWAADVNGGNGKYPEADDQAGVGNDKGVDDALKDASITWVGLKDAWGKYFVYTTTAGEGALDIYGICSYGPDGAAGGDDDILCSESTQIKTDGTYADDLPKGTYAVDNTSQAADAEATRT